MPYGLTTAGYTAPRQADYLTIIREEYDARLLALGYTEMPDYERDTFLGNITEILAYELGQLAEANQANYDARSAANATGLQLSNLALLVGVTRREATKSTATITCTGLTGTVITQGRIVEGGGSTDTARWVATEDGTIGGTVTGTVSIVFEAEEAGETVATIGQITTIVTPVAGWTLANNAADAAPGDDRETDGALRVRRQLALQGGGSTNTNAILSALLGLDFITGATVIDNKTAATVVVDGVTLIPYSVGAAVSPNVLTTAQKQSVLEAIYEKTGAGTATNGTETGTVTKRDGRSEAVAYFVAADTAVTVAYTLVFEAGYVAADVLDALEALVVDYFLTLTPGATVYPMPLVCLAAAVDGIENVTTLLINGAAVPVTHTIIQMPTLTTPITVT